MDAAQGDGRGLPRPVRAVAALAALIVVTWIAMSSVLMYRASVSDRRPSQGETTGTPTSEAATEAEVPSSAPQGRSGGEGEAASGAAVVVLIDGLNLRQQPSTGSRVIKRLKAGQRLLLVEEGDGWYRVKDVDGADGWVAAGGSYTRLEK